MIFPCLWLREVSCSLSKYECRCSLSRCSMGYNRESKRKRTNRCTRPSRSQLGCDRQLSNLSFGKSGSTLQRAVRAKLRGMIRHFSGREHPSCSSSSSWVVTERTSYQATATDTSFTEAVNSRSTEVDTTSVEVGRKLVGVALSAFAGWPQEPVSRCPYYLFNLLLIKIRTA